MQTQIRTFLFIALLAIMPVAAQHHSSSAAEPAADSDLGEITFPTSGGTEAQKHFIRGVKFLHSFEYAAAIRAFGEARKAEPGFAMAYWGEAMAWNHPIWGEQNEKEARNALALLGATPAARAGKAPTEREKLYLSAVEALYGTGDKVRRDAAYSNAMAELASRYPDDLEARAFYALSLLGLTGTDRNTENYMRGAAIAEEIFEKNRRHPGALHYMIHAYDDPTHAPLGLRAARLYGSVARGASHAQHMPSHIFFALGMWSEANAANIDSMKSARANGPGGYHPLHWLEHGYLQLGDEAEAAKLVAIVEDDAKKTDPIPNQTRAHLAMCRATWLIEADSPGPASMMQTVDPGKIASIGPFVGHDLAIGLAQVRNKDLAAARQTLQHLGARIQAGKARPRSGGDLASRYTTVNESEIGASEVMEKSLDAAIAFASGKHEDGIRQMIAAAEMEDRLIFEYGPPAVVKPAWESVGEMYLELGRNTEAAAAFRRVLARYPNRRLANAGFKKAAGSGGK